MLKRTLPEEHQLIIFCTRLNLQGPEHQEIKALLLSNNKLNWDKIISLARIQEITPFLFYHLNRLNLKDLIPQYIWIIMKSYYYLNLKKNTAFEKEFSLLLEAANRQGIDIIPFKGLALLQTLYHKNYSLREMVDIDFLVKTDKLPKIKSILVNLGYQINLCEKDVKTKQETKIVAVLLNNSLKNFPLFIEAHSALTPCRPYKVELPLLWQRAKDLSLYQQRCLLLSNEDTFLSLALHLRRHTRRLTLKFIVDISELLNTNVDNLDWNYIKDSAKNNRILATVYFALYISKELLNARIAPGVIAEFQPHIIKRALLYLCLNKYNFLSLRKIQGAFLRLLLFDRLSDLLFYLWRVSLLEQTKIKEYLNKIIPTNINEQIRK